MKGIKRIAIPLRNEGVARSAGVVCYFTGILLAVGFSNADVKELIVIALKRARVLRLWIAFAIL